ncbi:MAG: YceD family protein [Pseudomonadota bacterium]|nr:YceD family protein [Pseudomonadota bacterium]
MADNIITEFSRPILLLDFSEGGKQLTIAANQLECDALARRYSLSKLEGFGAKVLIKKNQRPDSYLLNGELYADIVQECVVTLEPVDSSISSSFSCIVDNSIRLQNISDINFSIDEIDPPEIIDNGYFDLGDYVSELLGLEINPFPRIVGAVFDEDENYGDNSENDGNRPFLALKNLKNITKKND